MPLVLRPLAPRVAVASALSGVLLLSACGGSEQASPAADPAATTVTVTDNRGEKKVATPPKSVIATDNRTFETLQTWGVKLAAAPRAIMPATNPYKTDESIVDLGSHTAPKMELVVAAQPTLIVNGQRFATKYDELAKLAPDATILDLEPRPGQPLDAELKRQTTVLGDVFGKQAEATKLNADLDAAVARVKKSYQPSSTVMAVNVSGGKIGYVAPSKGRTIGPLFDVLGLAPALRIENATNDHQGDDISVEAIAKSNPGLILVMDRDAAVGDGKAKPAKEVLEGAEALKGVDAIKNQRVVYMPADTYTNEGIQTYTEFLNAVADTLEKNS